MSIKKNLFRKTQDKFGNKSFLIPNSKNEIYIQPVTAEEFLYIDFGFCNKTESVWYELFETGLTSEDLDEIEINFINKSQRPELVAEILFRKKIWNLFIFKYNLKDHSLSVEVKDAYENSEAEYGPVSANIYG